jgi:cell fate regulator YaaT (PSP1 superfamily)
MAGNHLVRVGRLGWVGQFRAADSVEYPPHADVIVRTSRGLEVGQVVAPLTQRVSADARAGLILRGMTTEDRLLAARLAKGRTAALSACAALLSEHGLDATLIDVEHLFDGKSIYFYDLGKVSSAVTAMTNRLAETYAAQVNFRGFTEALDEGCGPACGTPTGGTGCASCQVGCALNGTCCPGGMR